MKKLLGFLAAVGLSATATTSVVSCKAASVLSDNSLTKLLGDEIHVQGKGDFLSEEQIKEQIKNQNAKINVAKLAIIKTGLDEDNNFLYVARSIDDTYSGQVIIHSQVIQQNLSEIITKTKIESKNKLTPEEVLQRVAVENGIKYVNTLQIVEKSGVNQDNKDENIVIYSISPKEDEGFYYTGSVLITYEWFKEDAKVNLKDVIKTSNLNTAKPHSGNKSDVLERIVMLNKISYIEELEISESSTNSDSFTYEIKVKAGAINYDPNSAPVKITEKVINTSIDDKIDLSKLKLEASKIDLGFNEPTEQLVREYFVVLNRIDDDNELVFEKEASNTFSWSESSEKWIVKAKADSKHYTGSNKFDVVKHDVKQFNLAELSLKDYDSGEFVASAEQIMEEINRQAKEVKKEELDFAYLNLDRGELIADEKDQTKVVLHRDWKIEGSELGKKHYANSTSITNRTVKWEAKDLACELNKRTFASADQKITKEDLIDRIMIENGLDENLRNEFTLTPESKYDDNGINKDAHNWLMEANQGSKRLKGSTTITTFFYNAKQFDLKNIVKTKFISVSALDQNELLRRIVSANDLPTTKDLVLEINKEKTNDSQVVYTLKATRDIYFVNDIEIVNTLHKVEKHNLTEYVNEANNNTKIFTINQLELNDFKTKFLQTADIAYIDEIEIAKGKENKDKNEQEFIIKAKADSLHYIGEVKVVNNYYTKEPIDLDNKAIIKQRDFASVNGLFFKPADLLNEFALANQLVNIDHLNIRILDMNKDKDLFDKIPSDKIEKMKKEKLYVWVVEQKEGMNTSYLGKTLVFNETTPQQPDEKMN